MLFIDWTRRCKSKKMTGQDRNSQEDIKPQKEPEKLFQEDL
jgi:hypothetical protein